MRNVLRLNTKHVLIIVFLFLAGPVDPARAEIVITNFTGAITLVSGTVFGSNLSVGQQVEGTITYDTSRPPIFDTGDVAGYIQPLPSGMSTVIGGVTVQSAGDASLQVINNHPRGGFAACFNFPGPVDNVNGFFSTVFVGQAFKPFPSFMGFALSEFGSPQNPPAVLSSSALPNPLDLLLFSERKGCIFDGESGGTVHFSINPTNPAGHLSGSVHGVGRGSTRTGLSMVGTFLHDGRVDLGAVPATLTITSLLNDGASDVAGLPLTLLGDPRNNATTAYFQTSVGTVPIAKVTIGARGGGLFTLRIEVSKATSVPSDQCPNTTLTTAFVIEDGVNSPVMFSTQQPWLCFGTGNQYLKLRP